MKKATLIALVLLVAMPAWVSAQLKKDSYQPNITTALTQPSMPSLFSWLDVGKIQMNHQLSMSFGMGAGGQVLQNAYINSMFIPFSENLTLQTNIGIMSTPYQSFGDQSGSNQPRFFGSAQLNYRISKNSSISLRIEKAPYNYGYGYGNGGYYGSPFSNYMPWGGTSHTGSTR